MTANCVGTLVTVNNNNASGTKVTGMVPISAGGVRASGTDRPSPTTDSQLTCFISTNVVKEHVARFVRRAAPQSHLAQQHPRLQRQPAEFCNANWNGTSMQFFIAG